MITKKKVVIKNEDLFADALQYLADGKDVKIRIQGNSMFPLMRSEKDEVVLRNIDTDKEQLSRNQIVLYKRANGQYVLHRIVKVYDKHLDMRGDAQKVIEENVPVDAVLGIADKIVRNGKMFKVNSIRHKVYFFFWSLLLPVRGRIVSWTSKI